MSMLRRSTSHALGALAEAGLISLLAVGLIAGTAVAAPGGKATRGTSSVSLVLLNSADAVPNHNELVTFTVSTTETDRPFVSVRCYQGSAFVYDAWQGMFAGAMGDGTFTLSSPSWTAGDADCTARLVRFTKRGSEVVLATLGFRVYA